jgi:hypothetical protein
MLQRPEIQGGHTCNSCRRWEWSASDALAPPGKKVSYVKHEHWKTR